MPLAENHHSDANRAARRLASHLLGPALLLVLTAGFYWKLTLTKQYTWLDSPDLAYQVLPWLQFQASEWHQGRLPLWDPNLWGGQSLIGQMQPGTAYPLNWMLFSLPLRDGRIRLGFLDGYFVLVHFMAALFCYWLCRDLKLARAASLLAGLAFGLGGYVGTTTWPQMINGAVWVPLIFLFLLRALRGRRPWTSAALSGLFTGMAWLSGHHQVPLLTCVAAGFVWLFFMFRRGRPDWRVARLAAVWLVLTALAGALQILPAYEYGRLATRWVSAPEAVRWNEPVPYSVHSEYSLHLYSLLGVLVAGIHRHTSPFIGVTGATLALLGVITSWKRRTVRVFAALALGGLLFSLGRDNVFHGILYGLVPLLEKARGPVMAVFMFHFGVAVLSGYGINQLLAARPGRPLPLPVFSAGLAGFGALVWLLLLGVVVVNKGQPPGDDRVMLAALVSLLLAALLYSFHRRALSRGTLAAGVFGLLLIELASSTATLFAEKTRTSFLSRLREAADIAQFLKQQGSGFRVEVDDQEVPYNFGDWHGLDHFGGYLASLPDNLLRMDALMPHRRALYGVAYTVTRKPPSAGQEQVFESPSGLKVYRNRDAFPRTWTVHNIVPVTAAGVDRGLDVRKTTFLEGAAPALESCAGEDRVRLARRQPDYLAVDAEMACGGMVIVNDNYFPGWQATVDGAPAQIYPAYVSLRGVAVPAGRHRIEMRYEPASVHAGSTLSLLALIVVLGIALWERAGTAQAEPKARGGRAAG